MRPSDRTIRDELRREAANASIPDDMWKNISQQLDQESVRKARQRRIMSMGEQWRPAVILAVAAGFFWFALIPSLPTSIETMPGNSKQTAIVIPASKTESRTLQTRAPRENDPGAATKTTVPGDFSTLRHSPTLPQ